MKKLFTFIFLFSSFFLFSQEFYDFETGAQGWVSGTVSTWSSNGWDLRTETGGCSAVALTTTWFGTPNDGSGCTDLNYENSYIQSPVLIANSSIIEINFDSYSSNESGLYGFDNEHIEMRINGGSWVLIHGYILGLHSSCDGVMRNHTVSTSGFLSVNAGDDVEIRFKYNTGDSCCGCYYITGWFVDNVDITGASTCTLEVSLSDPSPAIVYYGYDPLSCSSLTVTPTGAQGAVSYSWDVNGSSSSGAASNTVCATGPECLLVTVTATDAAGCEATASKLIQVVDVICHNENGIQKVEMCHKPDGNAKTLCIAPDAVQAHLDHGDSLGACGEEPDCGSLKVTQDTANDLEVSKNTRATQTVSSRNLSNNAIIPFESRRVQLYPNPVTDIANIQLHKDLFGSGVISVYNQLGQLVLSNKIVVDRNSRAIQINVENLNVGQYKVEINFDEGYSYSERLMIIKP